MFFSPPGVVAVWDTLDGSGSDFNITLSGLKINNNKYFSISTDNTTITLTKSGWYKFTFRTTFLGLSVADRYFCSLEKNGVTDAALMYADFPVMDEWETDASVYVQSDGNDVYNFNCRSINADSFTVAVGQDYNQIVLEFVP